MQLEPVNAPTVPADFHNQLRQRFLDSLKKNTKDPHLQESVSLWQGIPTLHKNYDDIDYLVEQESSFWYLFGVKEADCSAVIHHGTGKTILFVPFLSEEYKLWMHVKPHEEFISDYNVDEVKMAGELRTYLDAAQPSSIYLFSGVDSDSGLSVEEPSAELLKGFKVDRTVLWPLLSNLRAVKTQE